MGFVSTLLAFTSHSYVLLAPRRCTVAASHGDGCVACFQEEDRATNKREQRRWRTMLFMQAMKTQLKSLCTQKSMFMSTMFVCCVLWFVEETIAEFFGMGLVSLDGKSNIPWSIHRLFEWKDSVGMVGPAPCFILRKVNQRQKYDCYSEICARYLKEILRFNHNTMDPSKVCQVLNGWLETLHSAPHCACSWARHASVGVNTFVMAPSYP